LETLVFEKDVTVWIIEGLDAQHHESGKMTAGQSDVIQIVEADTELGTE